MELNKKNVTFDDSLWNVFFILPMNCCVIIESSLIFIDEFFNNEFYASIYYDPPITFSFEGDYSCIF